LDFWLGFEGVELGTSRPFVHQGIEISFPAPYCFSKILPNPKHPELRAFEYLRSIIPTSITPKVVIPSPNFLRVFRPNNDPYPSVYQNIEKFYDDIRLVLKEMLLCLYLNVIIH
jgi:hypothetical protein